MRIAGAIAPSSGIAPQLGMGPIGIQSGFIGKPLEVPERLKFCCFARLLATCSCKNGCIAVKSHSTNQLLYRPEDIACQLAVAVI